MILTEEKIIAIKKLLKKGVPEGEIKLELKNEGYADEEIAKAFVPLSYDMCSWYLVFGIIFLLLGIVVYIKSSSLLMILCAIGLLAQYYLANKKIQKEKQPNKDVE